MGALTMPGGASQGAAAPTPKGGGGGMSPFSPYRDHPMLKSLMGPPAKGGGNGVTMPQQPGVGAGAGGGTSTSAPNRLFGS